MVTFINELCAAVGKTVGGTLEDGGSFFIVFTDGTAVRLVADPKDPYERYTDYEVVVDDDPDFGELDSLEGAVGAGLLTHAEAEAINAEETP